VAGIEAQPLAELVDEGRILDLAGVAGDDVVEHSGHARRFADQDEVDAVAAGGFLELRHIGGRHGAAVIVGARALAFGDGDEQRRLRRRPRLQSDGNAAVAGGIETDRRTAAARFRRDRQVLGGAAQADEEVMVVRIDDGRAARQVGQDRDRVLSRNEAPGLRVVAVGGERGVAD
jgi:hypothetical protein